MQLTYASVTLTAMSLALCLLLSEAAAPTEKYGLSGFSASTFVVWEDAACEHLEAENYAYFRADKAVYKYTGDGKPDTNVSDRSYLATTWWSDCTANSGRRFTIEDPFDVYSGTSVNISISVDSKLSTGNVSRTSPALVTEEICYESNIADDPPNCKIVSSKIEKVTIEAALQGDGATENGHQSDTYSTADGSRFRVRYFGTYRDASTTKMVLTVEGESISKLTVPVDSLFISDASLAKSKSGSISFSTN